MKEEAIAWVTLALSTAVHVPLLLNDSEPRPEVQTKPAFVELTPLPPPPPPPPKAEEAPPPPEPEPPKLSPKKPKPVDERPSTEKPPMPDEPMPDEPITEPAPEVAPAELTGTTIVSDVGASWAAPAGNGAGRIGAMGTARPPKTKKRAKPPVRSPAKLPVVPLAELDEAAARQLRELLRPSRA
jgi:hypothetical protein